MKVIKSIEVMFLNENNERSETHKMTAKKPYADSVKVDPKKKLLTQAKKLMNLDNRKKWVMIVKCNNGMWSVFSNKVG